MNTYRAFHLILFILLLSIFSCKEPGCTDINAINYNSEANKEDNSCIYNTNLNINFRLVNGNTILNKYDTIFNDNYSFRLINLKFYLSDINLISDNNDIYLKDIHLFNIDDQETHSMSFEVEEGKYNGLNFGLGVNSEQNITTPAQYELEHPLGLSHNTFWAMEPASYIFVIVEGKMDTLQQNNFYNLTYHLAHDDLLKYIEFDQSKVVSIDENNEFNIDINLSRIFENVDFSDNLPHQRTASPLAQLLMNNFASCFEIQ